MSVKANLEAVAQKMYGKGIKDLADHDLYFAILQMTKEMMENKGRIQGSKKVYYISAEFLIGKLHHLFGYRSSEDTFELQ